MTLRVTRNPAPWRDRPRAYKVLVDGAVVGKIRNGESADFSVPPGHHEIRLKMDWTGSQVFSLDAEPGEVAHFECEPAGSSMTSFFDALAALGKEGQPWITLRRVSGDTISRGSATSSPASWTAPDEQLSPNPSSLLSPPDQVSAPAPLDRQDLGRPPEGTNGFATASVVLGVLWLFGVGSVLALVFGSVGKHQIARSAGRQGGRGMAITGMVLGWLGLAGLVVFTVLAPVPRPIKPATTPTTTTPSVAVAAQTYLEFIAPVNSAFGSFATEAAAWNSRTTGAQAESDARPSISALRDLEQQLLDTAWPTSVQHDIKTMAADASAVVGDLQGIARLNLTDASSWKSHFERDVTILKASDAAVRRDLDLPRSSSGGGASPGAGTSPSGRTSHPTSPRGIPTSSSPVTNTTGGGGSGTGAGGGSGNGGTACFGCVTITTVTWAFYAAPDISSEYENCIYTSTTATSDSRVIGPQQTDPGREFTYSVEYKNGCVSDGVQLAIGQVELLDANPPISIISTDPAVPSDVTPGTSQGLAVTFHALEGNYYDGPLLIDVIIQ
jgi:hypothetical protein